MLRSAIQTRELRFHLDWHSSFAKNKPYGVRCCHCRRHRRRRRNYRRGCSCKRIEYRHHAYIIAQVNSLTECHHTTTLRRILLIYSKFIATKPTPFERIKSAHQIRSARIKLTKFIYTILVIWLTRAFVMQKTHTYAHAY